ncbi:hydroxyisourate hydrolase [soil metagenome]
MSKITTHVLDTARGMPAAGITVTLRDADGAILAQKQTDADGRVKELGPEELPAGVYALVFDTARYYELIELDTFYPRVTIDFEIVHPDEHFHVPLLLGAFGYSTYRGS